LRLFFFTLTVFFTLRGCQNSKNKVSSVPSTAHEVFDTSKGVIIQNGLPKGGGYTDSTGKSFGYRIFWTRVFNETATPLELTINFPADSFAILPSPDSYFKLFLPPDTMKLDKKSKYDYGVTGLKSFFSGFNIMLRTADTALIGSTVCFLREESI